MTFNTHSQIYPGSFPHRDPPPNIPKNHSGWIALVLLGTVVMLLAALVLGFWRAAQAPVPVIESPTLDTPTTPPTQAPTPR